MALTTYTKTLLTDRLYKEFGYSMEQVRFEVPVHFGSSRYKADVVVFRNNAPYLVMEVLDQITDGVSQHQNQVISYALALGCEYAVVSDGYLDTCYQVKRTGSSITSELIPQIPQSGKTPKDIGRHSKEDLVSAVNIERMLTSIFYYMYRNGLALSKTQSVITEWEFLNEFYKIIAAKIYDERINSNDSFFRAHIGEEDSRIMQRVERLIEMMSDNAVQILIDKKVTLSASAIVFLVYKLQMYSLTKSGVSDMWEEVLPIKRILRSYNTGYYFAPPSLAEFVVELANLKPMDKVLDPLCGIGAFMITAAKKAGYVIGMDLSATLTQAARMNMFLAGVEMRSAVFTQDVLSPISTIKEDTLGEVSESSFDVIITQPPFNMSFFSPKLEYFASNRQQSERGETLLIEQLWRLLKPGGRLVMIVPEGLLSNESTFIVRKHILEEFKLIGVIGLPQGVFSNSSLRASIIILKKKEARTRPEIDYPVFMSVVKDSGYNKGTKTMDGESLSNILTAFGKFVKESKRMDHANVQIPSLTQNLRLDVAYYASQRKIGQARYGVVRLSDIADIASGIRANRIRDRDGEKCLLLKGQNIKNLQLDIAPAQEINCDRQTASQFSIRTDDICITRVGTVGNLAIAEMDYLNVIFSDNIIRIRVTDKARLDPRYIVAYLASDLGQTMIKRYATGTTVMGLNLTAVSNFEIPILPLDSQRDIAKQLKEVITKKKQIAELEAKYELDKENISLDIRQMLGIDNDGRTNTGGKQHGK